MLTNIYFLKWLTLLENPDSWDLFSVGSDFWNLRPAAARF